MHDKDGFDEVHISYAVRYDHYARHRKWRIAFRLCRSLVQTLPFFLVGSLISTVISGHHWVMPVTVAVLEVIALIVTLRLRRVSMRLFPQLDHKLLSY